MKRPKLRTEQISVRYWDCGSDHRHMTEEVASACIEKRERRARVATRKWTNQECLTLWNRHQEGESVSDIARSIGVSKTRVRQLFNRGLRLSSSNDPLDVLSTRARNVLRALDLSTVEQVRKAFDDRRLDRAYNFGKVCKAEVREFLDRTKREEVMRKHVK